MLTNVLMNWKLYFQEGSFLRNVVTLSSGSVAGNIILLATIPVISRLYLPEAFGVFSVFLSIFTIASVFASMNLQVALPLPRRDGTAANLLMGSLVLLVFFTLLSILIVHVAENFVDRSAVYDQIKAYGAWLPVAIAGAGANVILYYWLLRRRDYSSLAIVKVGQSGSMAAGQILIGLVTGSALGLIGGHIFSQIIGALAFVVKIFRNDRHIFRQVRASRARKVTGCYQKFSLQYTPGIFVSTLTLMLPPIILTAMFGVAVAGLYAFTTRAIRGGLSLIVQSVTRVAYIRCVDLRNAHKYEQILNFYLKLCSRLSVIGIVPFAMLFFWGEEIFSLVFGENWSQAGVMAAYLVPGLFCFMVFDQSLNIFVIMNKQYTKFIWELLRFFLMCAVFAAGYFLGLETLTLILWLSVTQALGYGIVFVLCIRIIRKARDQRSIRTST